MLFIFASCKDGAPNRPDGSQPDPEPNDTTITEDTFQLADIDLHYWKVTLPVTRSDGRALEISPPDILDYATNEILKPFMYNDSTDGSIVFYTYPGATTANTSYSRTELRELMDGGNGTVNWTFAQGGHMKGTLSVPEITEDANGEPYRTIVMQIHGRLTNAQRDLIGAKDNNAPPMLKIYWVDGKVRVKTKVLKNLNATYEELLQTDAWGDDAGKTFAEYVGTEKFTLEVRVSDGHMSVTLNDNETFVYDDIHIEKWGVFENYFKAGNYFQSLDDSSFAKVKYYNLVATHE